MYIKSSVSVIPLLLLLALFTACSKQTSTTRPPIAGTVKKVIDGDSFELLTADNSVIRVKMEGIDASEKGMPFYNESRKFLKHLCLGKAVRFLPNGICVYNKQMGMTFLENGTELGHEMVREGMAWQVSKFNTDKKLYALEARARLEHRGLWIQDNPVPPRTVRKYRRMGTSRKDFIF